MKTLRGLGKVKLNSVICLLLYHTLLNKQPRHYDGRHRLICWAWVAVFSDSIEPAFPAIILQKTNILPQQVAKMMWSHGACGGFSMGMRKPLHDFTVRTLTGLVAGKPQFLSRLISSNILCVNC